MFIKENSINAIQYYQQIVKNKIIKIIIILQKLIYQLFDLQQRNGFLKIIL